MISTLPARAQSPSQPLVTQAVNEASLVPLPGNTRAEARDPANDRGIVPDSMALPHMLLQLRRPAAQDQALNALIDQLHDAQSPNYHRWLSPAEVGAQFGPAASDIAVITGWLTQHGFAVNSVYPNGMVIDFSGTAGQVRNTFHTEIHNLSVNGVAHFANMSDPQIPTALAPAVVGIVSLHDFRPRPGAARNPAAPLPSSQPNYTSGGNYWVTPADLATIYNFNPVFSGGNTGQGQTIYLIEDSDLYTSTDWTTFRTGFGIPVSSYPGASLTTVHPGGCTDPGANGDGGEASLDAEYASAAAPSAAIVMATCAGTASTGGWVIAIENLLTAARPPSSA
ncbi:MAG TPA: protease pro-enzyme activation domain-containing protein [Xanthobacteraceae bacterium]|nr:protease pro-enzyme activation domain-containing protein [Xanthobacteraceae bacterium]